MYSGGHGYSVGILDTLSSLGYSGITTHWMSHDASWMVWYELCALGFAGVDVYNFNRQSDQMSVTPLFWLPMGSGVTNK